MGTVHIASTVIIRNNSILRNGEIVFQDEGLGNNFLLRAYEEGLKINYPKFYKMDALGKLGILATDVLLKESHITDNYQPEEVGIVLCNRNASIQADRCYFETAKTFPSPALFVYTLPNIVIGEISIRYQFKGENAFFINESFNAEWLHFYVNELVQHKNTKACICGWIEAVGDSFDVCLFLVESNETQKGLKFVPSEMDRMYNQTV